MKKLLPILLFVFGLSTQAQDYKRTQNWYFGDSAGLSFATDPPTVLTDGQMYALEGCATMSDTDGNLLFYTNGLTVWNKNHQVMLNGTGLFGYESSAQAALIVPQPGNDSIFYIFTNGGETILHPFVLRYSIINIWSKNGLGEVIGKNIFLTAMTNATEKLAATHHANGRDVWVATHGRGNNHLFAFLVTDRGVMHCPVISEVGSVMTGGAVQTEMRFSPSGRMAGVLFWNDGFMELVSFDKQTGKFSNPIKVVTSPGWVSGFAFSNDEKWLVLSARWRWIRCYSLDTLSILEINNSMRTLYADLTNSVNGQFCNTMDNRLLFNWAGKNYLGGIQFGLDDSVIFIDSAVSIAPRTGTYGMPQFISSYFYNPVLDFTYHINCNNDSVFFKAKGSQILISPTWNIYRDENLIHSENGSVFRYNFPDTGTYWVQLIHDTDTISKDIVIESRLYLGNDTTLCNTNELVLVIPNALRCIQWQDGADTTVYTITENGTYYVSAYNNRGCLLTDSIHVLFSTIPKPEINRTGDRLETDSNAFVYQWYFNDNPIDSNKHFTVAKGIGEYKVRISNGNGCISFSDPFNVNSLSIQTTQNSGFKVYPNPSKVENTIWIESEETILELRILDIHGKAVFKQQNINHNTYQIKLPNQGLYIFHINNTHTYKLMIE